MWIFAALPERCVDGEDKKDARPRWGWVFGVLLFALTLPVILLGTLLLDRHIGADLRTAAVARAKGSQGMDLSGFVNVFLGTEGGGNMFPGVVAEPFAMVKLGVDVVNGNTDAYSGYLPQGKVFGFSMMHESGTGGAPKYGVASQMPANGTVENPLVDLSTSRASPDEGSVGYYKTSLDNSIVVELTATARAGLYQYSLPAGENSIIVDVSHVLSSFRGLGWGQGYAGGKFEVLDDDHYEGSGTYNNGWNLSPDWTIYFCGYFDQAAKDIRTFTGNGTTIQSYDNQRSVEGDLRLGGVFSFDQQTVTSRVGVSFISSQQACSNVNAQIPSGTRLDTVVSQARQQWSDKLFNKVRTTDTDQNKLTQLYSYLYGMNLIPSNRTGENAGWQSSEPYWDDIFTFWDLFRCSTALTHVLTPDAYEEQLRSLIDVWKNEGFLPDARSSNFNGRTQGGSNADNVLADAYVKGVRGQVNWEDAYKAMKTDAEQVPVNNNDHIAPDASTKEGRGALPDWLKYGWITPTFTRAVSRAVEYSANDFGLSVVAGGLGLAAEADTYLNRSRNWRNHWNPDEESLGFKGFVVPRRANGSFEAPYDALQCGGCYWGDPYYQGLPWEYSFNAHHDMAKMIEWSGGVETFTRRLETLFQPGVKPGNERFNNTIFNPANEPSFTSPYLFNYVNRQDLSVKYSRNIATSYYNTGVQGLPGNSDAGAMQTWILWNMIGLYPMTGQTTFLVGSPWFADLTIDLGGGKRLQITSTTEQEQTEGYYVQSLKVNGQDWDRGWVSWQDIFAGGGTLDFVLGAEPKNWTTGAVPPSPASGA
ncbi:putative glycosyl hydrolase family 92 protein 1 [Elsinoe fawcettii]|nr:putative glycosyl hydrolase family 92 protein 1 [Elsinoe fawcettii]